MSWRIYCVFHALHRAIEQEIVGRKRRVRLANAKERIILYCTALHAFFSSKEAAVAPFTGTTLLKIPCL